MEKENIMHKELLDYLKSEEENYSKSREIYSVELQLFSEIISLFNQIPKSVKSDSEGFDIIGILLLNILSLLHGSASHLLRCRITDVQVLNRLSAEYGAIAYHVWRNPNLSKEWWSCYPQFENQGHPRQFRPSDSYKKNFSSGEIFKYADDDIKNLQIIYEFNSATYIHGGPGTTKNIEQSGPQFSLTYGDDREEVLYGWYATMLVYIRLLSIFSKIFESSWISGQYNDFRNSINKTFELYLEEQSRRMPFLAP
ncbi:MAG: hypothetical protein ACYDBV_02985 [Nitrospiria bacterium]